MARPVWSGTISFGLIAIPVKLFHAVRRKSVSFNQLDERNLARIRYRKVNADTGEEVSDDHIVKGYEISKGRYVIIDPDELEPFMPVVTKTVDLEEFVDLDEIDPVYFDTAYHLAPGTDNPKPYVLLARAMEASGKVAIGRFVMRNKQYTAAIRAEDGRLVMSSLAYADEVVDPSTIDELAGLDDVEVNAREIQMAESLVESLSAEFVPERYHDEYREQVMALIQMKADGEEITAPEPAADMPKVVDIMAALEASVAAAKASRARHPAKKAAAGKPSASKPTAASSTKTAAKRKPASNKAAAKNAAPKKSTAKKSTAKKSTAKKSTATKQVAAKKQAATTTKKSVAKKSA
jgi:DNA end-binding protein Ku